VLGTICVGLFAQDGITGVSTGNGLFYGGGFTLLGSQLIGILCTAVFVFPVSLLIWYAIKKTIGLRVQLYEEIQGLDVFEHGHSAYPEYVIRKPVYSINSVREFSDREEEYV